MLVRSASSEEDGMAGKSAVEMVPGAYNYCQLLSQASGLHVRNMVGRTYSLVASSTRPT